MKRTNYLGWLSLLSLISVLGWKSGNTGLYGFFGFIYFLRYFWMIPDEMFLLNVQKSATIAFMLSMVSLVPLMFSCSVFYNISAAIPMAFALSFVVSTLAFTFVLTGLEWRERRGAKE